ncbi:MAG: acyl-CoA dehydrogenase family protein [Myxococcota bacterium]
MAGYLNDSILLYVNRLADWDLYYRLSKGEEVDVDAERQALVGVLETAAEICQSIEPLAREGWDEEATLSDDQVEKPAHIREGYARLAEAGLVAVGIREEFGGFELPTLLGNVLLQMVARADAALMTVMGLQAGVANDIQKYASRQLCERYLPGFISGELQGAMDLTEPQAGSDLGGIVTRALDEGDHSRLQGQKIFITNGGSEIHLVLARDGETFDESKGTTRGLSLFVCPRTLPDGRPNTVHVERLEHKLGIHGSPTAVVRFDDAEAWRIGTRGEGFKAMLNLMNEARLGVAAQGIGIAEAALQEAVRYAKQRKQFGIPIGQQPLMKNMLSRMIVSLEASRALLYRCSCLVDRSRALEKALESDERSEAERSELQRQYDRVEVQIRLLTPLAKYLATESCDSISREAIQVHGGLGFMAESVVGRLHLDAIITTIYEGTSEIQISFALKEIGKGALGIVFEELEAELSKLTEEPLAGFAAKVRRGIERIGEASSALLQDFSYALLSSRLVAEMVISVIAATELLAQAAADPRRTELAARWIHLKLPELEMHAQRLETGDAGRIERSERIIELFDDA